MLSSLNSAADGQLHCAREFAAFLYHRWKWFKRKGMAVILTWNFAAFSIYSFLLNNFVFKPSASKHSIFANNIIALEGISVALFLPLIGWLADVYIGRYRVIKVCVKLMWVGAILLTLITVLLDMELVIPGKKFFFIIASIVMFSGVCGFQANILQFSMDQFFDSASDEVVSYISFYCWSYYISDVVIKLALCICAKSDAFLYLLISFFLTLAVSSDFLFNHWLVKEPVTHNPLKLIFKILRYAVKHKYPYQRSAFTYWDDRRYSRIDLAKRKYGGPFSTEQVENVKTFFRILCIFVVGCLLFGLLMSSSGVAYISIFSRFKGVSFQPCLLPDDYIEPADKACFTNIIANAGSFAMVLGIPFWEFFLFPIFWKCCSRLKIFGRLITGMVLMMAYLVLMMPIELIGQFSKLNSNESMDQRCALFYNSFTKHSEHFTMSYGWLAIPSVVYNLGAWLISLSGLQFISAQAPYAMKGLLFGLLYFCMGISLVLFHFFPMLFKLHVFSHKRFGCMFWYLLASIVVAAVLILALSVALYCYKNRLRDDNLPNQHFFAENYYDRQLENSVRNRTISPP